MAQSTNIKEEASCESELHLVVFKLSTEEFCVEIKTVQEIIRMVNITEIPRAPLYVNGIINLRGRIIVVISLNAIMGMPGRAYDASTRIIVADIEGTVMGFIVDSVSEVIRLSSKNIETTPSIIMNKIKTEYFKGVGKVDDRMLILLNLDKMLNAEELIHLHKISPDASQAAAT